MFKKGDEVFIGDRRYYTNTIPYHMDGDTLQEEKALDILMYYSCSDKKTDDLCDEISSEWPESINNERLYRAVKKLNPTYQKMLKLLAADGMSQEDAAEQCGITQGTFSAHLKKIRNFINKEMNRN